MLIGFILTIVINDFMVMFDGSTVDLCRDILYDIYIYVFIVCIYIYMYTYMERPQGGKRHRKMVTQAYLTKKQWIYS